MIKNIYEAPNTTAKHTIKLTTTDVINMFTWEEIVAILKRNGNIPNEILNFSSCVDKNDDFPFIIKWEE